jgi:2-polyprenyl-3-methyl-5-hydroxy-6-metoxy-1,4-benzoquinol methylase
MDDKTDDGDLMVPGRPNILSGGRLDLGLLHKLAARPPLFEPGEPLFWNDSHISKQMLAAHLDPELEAASRPPEVIERTVEWLSAQLGLQPGHRLLDLGCGPGLYSTRFAERGVQVTGVDYSRRSIEYAVDQAHARGLPIEYLYRDYVSMDAGAYAGHFHAIVLIYGDICVLNDEARDRVLANVHTMLTPGGLFAFDVTTPAHHDRYGPPRNWSASLGGFWKPRAHLVLDQLFDYPEDDVYLRRSVVVEEDGEVSDYRIWTHLYSKASMEPVLSRADFKLLEVWSDLAGTPYDGASEWLGFLARRLP